MGLLFPVDLTATIQPGLIMSGKLDLVEDSRDLLLFIDREEAPARAKKRNKLHAIIERAKLHSPCPTSA